jgi:hypothetical protein
MPTAGETGAKGEVMDGLWENWQDGGWGMWPILVFGLLALVGSARFAWRGDHVLTGFIRWMALTTASSALLGFLAGMHKVLHVATGNHPRLMPPKEMELAEFRVRVLLEGTKEASSCLIFGLILLTLVCLLLAIGYRRFPAPEAA